MALKRFATVVGSLGPDGESSAALVPFSVEREWRSRGPLRVRGTLNGQPLRSRVVPVGDGTHQLLIPRTLMAHAKCFVGDTVQVELEPDSPLPRPARGGAPRAPAAAGKRLK